MGAHHFDSIADGSARDEESLCWILNAFGFWLEVNPADLTMKNDSDWQI